MNRADLITAIRKANTENRWFDFVGSIKMDDDPDQFATIFAHAVEPQSIDSAVYDAAKLLYESNLTCRMPCEDAILAMLHGWDVSIEEVPWYLTNQFGVDKMLAAIDVCDQKQPNESARTILKTVRYWVNLNPARA